MHLIYALPCSELPPEDLVKSRLDGDYRALLAEENDVYAESPSQSQRAYITTVVCGVAAGREALDARIDALSERWSVRRISSLVRAILELAIYEALYMEDVPVNVAINEAVVLAKKYEDAETVGFINGVLGGFARGLSSEKEGAPSC